MNVGKSDHIQSEQTHEDIAFSFSGSVVAMTRQVDRKEQKEHCRLNLPTIDKQPNHLFHPQIY